MSDRHMKHILIVIANDYGHDSGFILVATNEDGTRQCIIHGGRVYPTYKDADAAREKYILE